MTGIINISRREFLKAGALAGGGLLLGFYLPGGQMPLAAEAALYYPNAFIRIGSDESVTIMVNKSEMGQGVYTSIPMLVAEELECDWSTVRAEPAPVAPVYNNLATGMQMTGGSTSIKSEWERMREVGAAAREMLIAAAAETWKVDAGACRAENGRIIHTGGQSLSYGQLAEKAAGMPVPSKVSLKDPAQFKILGKPARRLDTSVKVLGKARFGCDAQVPGMLTALVARPPVFGGKVKSFRGAKAKAVPGVKEVVQIEAGIAVVADGYWAAKRGRDLLEITWDEGPHAMLSTDAMREDYARMAQSPGLPARKDGDPESALASADKKLTAEYFLPYLAHASMEPLNCLVDLSANSCEIWTGTQSQTANRDAAVKTAGLRPDQVKLHTTYLGGGFGRRGNPHSDFVNLAMQVAKAVKQPVKVLWTREDDMRGYYYRPLWHSRMSGGLDRHGNLVAWHHTIVGQSIMKGTVNEKKRIKNGIDSSSVEGAADVQYEIPNLLVDLHSPEVGVPVQWWRSVGHSHTGFVVESFMDELAHAAGKDSYRFRRVLLAEHPRPRGVLDAAAQMSGWGTPPPKGRARGIAMCESYGSFVCQVAEVSVNREGKVRVHRVFCAVDCGSTINPSIIEAQMQSGIVYGLSAALYGAITIRQGRVEQENFDDYPVLRMDEMPVVEVRIISSTEKPGGIGEPGVPPIAPAVTNAVFAATGKRIRSLPIDNRFLKKAPDRRRP